MTTEIATKQKQSLLTTMATRYGVEPNKMLATLKDVAFQSKEEITNEQMVALLVVANEYGLNPFTKEIYAFPDKQKGIIPVVGVDGWSRIINSSPVFDGMEFNYAESNATVDGDHRACPEWIECVIYRKDRTHPTKVREKLADCYRPAFVAKSGHHLKGPWQTHTERMLRHKAMIQCARLAMGYTQFYDPDEAERVVEGAQWEEVEVTRDADTGLAGVSRGADLPPSNLPETADKAAQPDRWQPSESDAPEKASGEYQIDNPTYGEYDEAAKRG